MSLETLVPFAPFVALLYVFFALVQSLRHKQQGLGALVLALIALGLPLAAYLLPSGVIVRAALVSALALNAVIVFFASLLVLFIERRNRKRQPNHSYGMVGVGLSVLLALAMFALPLLPSSSPAAAQVETAADSEVVTDSQIAQEADSTLRNISAVTPGAFVSSTANDQPAAQVDTSDQAATPTEVAQVLAAQTGVAVADLTVQLESATIADLVAASNGDLDAVIEAVAAALDELTSAGGMQAQMLARLGEDTTQIATQFVNGELAQAQQLLLPLLLTGEMPQFGGQGGARGAGGNFAPPTDGEGAFAPLDGTVTDGSFAPPADAEGGFAPPDAPLAAETPSPEAEAEAEQPTPEPTAAPVTPTEVVARPTRISFPTATPTPDATDLPAEDGEALVQADGQVADSQPSASQSSAGVADSTCALVVDFNLNVRDLPTTEGSTVLTSIPFGNLVTSDAQTEDNWYRISYDGTQGWVTGEYVTAGAACASLPVVDGA